MPGALAGIRVIEIASYVTGPFAGALLGDLGAEVIKIEDPIHGDPFRGWGDDQYSPTFCALNRNKKSVALDLREKAGQELLLKLIDTCDVVIENHRPGIAEKMGFGFELVHKRNSKAIYCSITGFGEDGPYSDRPGYDTVGQAISGLLSLLTNVENPEPMGISLSDHITGLYACCAVLAGIAARSLTGEGQLVSTSLLQATIHIMGENAQHYFHSGKAPLRETRVRQAQVYAFKGSDGLPFVIHLSSPAKFWEGLAKVVGRSEWLADERFKTRADRQRNYPELDRELKSIFATKPREHWLAQLNQCDVPAAPLNTLADAFADPQVQHLGLKLDYRHPVRGNLEGVAAGFSLANTPLQVTAAPPMLGEHTIAVLKESGLSQKMIDQYKSDGAFGKSGGNADNA